MPRQLSGGQEQRVAIARAIATDPDLILADEPTGTWMPASAQDVLTLLSRLNKEFGKTIVMVTHDPHAASFASKVSIWKKASCCRTGMFPPTGQKRQPGRISGTRLSRLLQRLLLGALLVVFVPLQLRFAWMTMDLVLHWNEVPRRPFFLDPDMKMVGWQDLATKDGMKAGDVLIAEDGQPVRSIQESNRVFYRHKSGERTTLTLRRGAAAPFDVSIAIPHREKQTWVDVVAPIALNIITPWFCLILGFFAVFRRPGDPVAYALLFLLLCMSQLVGAEAGPRNGWGPLFTWPLLMIDNMSGALFAAWFWFALVFPNPASPYKLFGWARWFIALPYLVYLFLQALASSAYLHQRGALVWLHNATAIPHWLDLGLRIALVSMGFANFAYKLRKEAQPAMRRRLRYMLAGLTIGTLPVAVLFTLAETLKLDLNHIPTFILLPIVATPIFVPLTLAYAVLVDRLFDIGVFVRHGLLASKAVGIVRAGLFVIVLLLASTLESRKDLSSVERWTVVACCAAAALLVRRGSQWLRGWVDRHFFQEAVNTEHLLIELSAEVRRITNPDVLLRTVTERLSNALHVSRVTYAMAGDAAFSLALSEPVLTRLQTDRQPITHADQLLLPIGTAEGLHGILSLGPKRSEEPYSGQDIRLLESVADQTALALENSRLTATVAAEAALRERITSELEIARQVQQRLLPRRAPLLPGLDLAGHCQPAQTVGGDYFDFLTTPSGDIGLAIGDVAGKGIPASLLMAALQASLRGLTLAGISRPAELMEKLNMLIYDATPLNRFATFFYGLYDPATRCLRYSSAGHNPALLYRSASGETFWLKTRGIGLGLKRNSTYAQAELILEPGDILILYTDGVTEARNHGDAEFGEDGLLKALQSKHAWLGGGAFARADCGDFRVCERCAAIRRPHADCGAGTFSIAEPGGTVNPAPRTPAC